MEKLKIVYKSVDDLIPYINNPRINDHAVDAVASSIKNFGFRVPVIIDKGNEIVAGHTRIKAAKKLGMKEVPVIVASDLDENQLLDLWRQLGVRMNKYIEKYPRKVKERVCVDCGLAEIVVSYNRSERCMSCSARIAGAVSYKNRKRNVKKCSWCGAEFEEPPTGKKFCSAKCLADMRASLREQRTCKQCGNNFDVLKSSLRTNASGNFCCRKCYEDFMCEDERITGRGSRWKKTREIAKKRTPFCVLCGRTGRLDVHHIVPFRLTQDNSQENLTVLCKKCHKQIEYVTQEVENSGASHKNMKLILGNILETHRLARLNLMTEH